LSRINATGGMLPDVADVRHEGDLAARGLGVSGDEIDLIEEHLDSVDRESGAALMSEVEVILRVRDDGDRETAIRSRLCRPRLRSKQSEESKQQDPPIDQSIQHDLAPLSSQNA
jgi:hypothetical protein